MADQVVQNNDDGELKISGDDNIGVKKNSSGSEPLKINNASGKGIKKTADNTIEINADLKVPNSQNPILQQNLAALTTMAAAASMLANSDSDIMMPRTENEQTQPNEENDEKNQINDLPDTQIENQQNPDSTPKEPSQIEPPTDKQNEPQPQAETEAQPNTNPKAQDQKNTPNQPAHTDQPSENENQPQPTKEAETEQPTEKPQMPEQIPPQGETKNEDKIEKPKNTETETKPSENENNTTNQNTEQTPSSPPLETPSETEGSEKENIQKPGPTDEQLRNIGPSTDNHDRTPPNINPEEQMNIGNDLDAQKSKKNETGPNIGNSKNGIMDRLGQKANPTADNKEKLQNVPEDTKNNIANQITSDTGRKRQLLKQHENLRAELDKIDGRISSSQATGAMRVIKFFFPGIYYKITSLTTGIGPALSKLKEGSQLKYIQAKLVQIKFIRYSLLEPAKVVAAIIDAAIETVELITALYTGIITGIIATIFAPFIFLPIFIFTYGSGSGSLTLAIKEILDMIKETEKILEETYKKLKNKLKIKKEMANIKIIMNSDEENRKNYLAQQQNKYESKA